MLQKQLQKGLDIEGLTYYDAVQKQRFKRLEATSGGASLYIQVTCSQAYEGATVTATSTADKSTYTATVSGGKALIKVSTPGAYTVTNSIDDKSESITVDYFKLEFQED